CHVDVDERTAVTLVLASEGYPGKFEKGKPVTGLEQVRDAYVFQAGTVMKGERLLTAGGRVMAVTAFGKDLEQAIASAYRNAASIGYEGKYLRMDIGHDLVRTPAPKAGAQPA